MKLLTLPSKISCSVESHPKS